MIQNTLKIQKYLKINPKCSKFSKIHIFKKKSSNWSAFYADLHGITHILYILYILYILFIYLEMTVVMTPWSGDDPMWWWWPHVVMREPQGRGPSTQFNSVHFDRVVCATIRSAAAQQVVALSRIELNCRFETMAKRRSNEPFLSHHEKTRIYTNEWIYKYIKQNINKLNKNIKMYIVI